MPQLTRDQGDDEHDSGDSGGDPGQRPDGMAAPPPVLPTDDRLLDELGRAVWDEIVLELRRHRAFIGLDRHLLLRYCWYLSRWLRAAAIVNVQGEAEQRTNKSGQAYTVRRQEFKDLLTYEELLIRHEKLLGITPGARARIKELLENGAGKSGLDEFVSRRAQGKR